MARRLGLALALLAAGCTAPTPEASPATPLASVGTVPAPSREPTANCDEARQRWLLETFFLGYNARTKGAAAVFRFGPSFQYYDSVDGEAVDLRDDRAFASYLERRWALGDTFDVDVQAIGLSVRSPNPTFAFRRTSVQGTYAGNAKFVCEGGLFSGLVMSAVATTRSACDETPAARGLPSNANTASFSRSWWASDDRRIWASRADRMYVGDNKVLWERPLGEKLEVTGQPVGAQGIDVTASVPAGYEQLDYQASGVSFPVAGCWLVIARAGATELRIVTEVYPEAYRPSIAACRDLADAAADSRWIVMARVESSEADRPGFVQHRAVVARAWKGSVTGDAAVAIGHELAVWQDALYEPVLERGRSYVLLLATPSYGSPQVRYGLTRILCPLRTIMEIRGTDVSRPARYSPQEWIWSGGTFEELDRELTKVSATR
jgi:hypothetical protein